MVNLLFVEDDEILSRPGVVRTIYEPRAGTGGMLSVAGEYLTEHNPQARLTMFGRNTVFLLRSYSRAGIFALYVLLAASPAVKQANKGGHAA
jgi:hypothetical protein